MRGSTKSGTVANTQITDIKRADTNQSQIFILWNCYEDLTVIEADGLTL